MQKFQGYAVSPGVVIGEALVIDNEGFKIPRRHVPRAAVAQELVRLEQAFAAAAAELAANRDAIARELGRQCGAIFDAHLQMLDDPHLRGEVTQLVHERAFSPEFAVTKALGRYAEVFQNLGNSYLAERAHDVRDIEKRLLHHLLGQQRASMAQLAAPVLILAHNLTPSETANLSREFVRGFGTEIGGPGSHTAIVAEALNIPAVVGVGGFLGEVVSGDTVIIDGDQGLIILQPDEPTVAAYRREAEQIRSLATRLEAIRDLPAETRDGVRVQILGNIEFPYEVEECLKHGSDGVGLYRTEFLYLGAAEEPSEQVQFAAYSEVVRAMRDHPVVIRTLDLGADKVAGVAPPDDEKNPVLGLRSIRLSLRHLRQFRTQLRAILRASALGDVRVMFPLISTLAELRQTKMVVADVMEDLQESGLEFNPRISLGMMVEVPAAAVMIDHFVPEVDFVSIGTNDLVQYTLAVDRGNKDVANLYNNSDPAVLRLIERTLAASHSREIPVNLCGQMSGSPHYTMLLLGLGLRQFSVPPSAIPEIKQVCRSVSLDQCRQVAQRVMTMESARNIRSYLKDELKKSVPEIGG